MMKCANKTRSHHFYSRSTTTMSLCHVFMPTTFVSVMESQLFNGCMRGRTIKNHISTIPIRLSNSKLILKRKWYIFTELFGEELCYFRSTLSAWRSYVCACGEVPPSSCDRIRRADSIKINIKISAKQASERAMRNQCYICDGKEEKEMEKLCHHHRRMERWCEWEGGKEEDRTSRENGKRTIKNPRNRYLA